MSATFAYVKKGSVELALVPQQAGSVVQPFRTCRNLIQPAFT